MSVPKMPYVKSAENLPRAFTRMLGDAETAELADLRRRDFTDKMKPFGFDADLDQKDNPNYPVLQQILAPAVRSDLVRQMLGSDLDPEKFKSIWEKYLPHTLSAAEQQASDTLLRDPNLSWGPFLSDPSIEEALVDNVIYRFLDDLSQTGSYVENGAKVLEDWREKCPGSYATAEAAVTDYMEMAYRSVKKVDNEEAITAIKQVRMMSHCLLHGHITGRAEFEISPELGGASTENVLLSSPTMEKMARFNRGLYMQVARMQLGVVNVKLVEYGTKPVGEHTRGLRAFLDMSGEDKRNPYEVLFDRLVEETNPKAMMFERGDMKWSPEHCINQITRSICPILAMDVQKLRQKNMEPSLLYNLYKLSRHLRKMDMESVFPLLGTGMLPAGMPPNFGLRFDPAWSKRSPVVAMMTPAALASAGFNPIVHEGMRDVVAKAKKLMPDMMTRLEKADTLSFLKRAHTRDILVEPVRVTIMQREFLKAFRTVFSDNYFDLSFQELKKRDPLRYGSMNLNEFKNVKESAWFEHSTPKEKALIRSCVYKGALKYVAQNQDAPALLEEAMMAGRSFKVMELRLDPSLRGVFPAQPSADMDYSEIKAPSNGALASFEAVDYPYLNREDLNHAYLSNKHFQGLCADGKSGVLSAEMIAMQGIFSTANADRTLRAYTCNHPALRDKQRRYCTMLTKEAEDTGILLIPYQLEKYEVGDTREPMNRIRTVRTTPKYLSAMSEALKSADLDANPLYIANVLLNPDMLKVWAKIMVQRTAGGKMPQEQAEQAGFKLLEHLKFDRLSTGLKDTNIPIFAIEGEKKALSVLESQLRQFERALGRMIASPNPAEYDFSSEKVPPLVIPIGTIGVWNTVKSPGTNEHVLNPAFRAVPLEGRTFIIGQDSDGKNNPGVTAAAAFAATELKKAGAKPMYWKPPAGPGKGFDDWIEAGALASVAEHGGTWKDAVAAGYATVPEQLLPRCLPLRTGLTYSDVTKAQAKGADLQEFITIPNPQLELS